MPFIPYVFWNSNGYTTLIFHLSFVFAAHRAASVHRSRGKANGFCFVEILRGLNGTVYDANVRLVNINNKLYISIY